MNISIEEMPREIARLEDENDKLQEDLNYSNYCNEELRKKITNLNYKITTLEEYIKDLENRTPIASKKFYGDGREELQDRIDKAIEYIEERYNGEVLTHTFDKDNVGELLEILKGE